MLATTMNKTPKNNPAIAGLVGVGSDLLLWLVITGVVVGITTLCDMDTKQLAKHKTTIMLTLQDAYSLSKGSMVRLMGVPIGYVDNVKLAPNNSVIVLLKLNPDITTLPAGAKGTVVAYGLGGSKSLDFELPTATEKQAGSGREAALSVSNPLRQKALLQAQIEVAKTLEAGANSLADSLNHFPTLQQQGNITKVRDDSFHMINGQEQLITALIKFQKQLSTGVHSAKTLVETFRSSTEKTDKWVSLYSPKVLETLNHQNALQSSLKVSGEGMETGRSLWGISQGLQSQVKGLQFELKPLNTKLQHLETSIQKLKTNLNESAPTSPIEKIKQWHQKQIAPLVIETPTTETTTPIKQVSAPKFPAGEP
ncbi:MAG: MCE family protein [Vampirovibrio sp.]|nr:MCE family protein [Vampirovibrio sp.]